MPGRCGTSAASIGAIVSFIALPTGGLVRFSASMTPRDFICTPSTWVNDPKLNALSDDAELLFRRMASCTDAKWRFAYDPNAEAHSVRTGTFSPQRRFRAWNPERIRRSLNELTASGILIRHCQGDRHWFEVSRQYQYQKGRDPFGIEQPTQPELGLQGEFSVLPPKPHDQAKRVIPVRTESEPNRTDDSGSRAQLRGNDSGRFAVDECEHDDDVWRMVIGAVGLKETTQNGKLWDQRWREDRPALREACADYLVKTPGERATIINRGAWITERFEFHRKRLKTG